MKVLERISLITLFSIFILGPAQAISINEKIDAQVEGKEKEFTKVLRWVDEETGQKLFDIDDIVWFDWDKQIFELTRSAAMDFMSMQIGLHNSFVLTDSRGIIYEGNLVSTLSSMSYPGPVIIFKNFDEINPPLFKISNGYPGPITKNDSAPRFSERLKKVLQKANVLSEFDISDFPPPIKSETHGWFGEKEGLRALIEVFPETFRLSRSARVHIHLAGVKDLDKNHVVEVNATLVSKGDKSKFSTKRIFPSHGSGWKNIYILEMNPWKNAKSPRGKVKTGHAKLNLEISTRKKLDERAKTYSEPINRVQTDAINVRIQSGRALLPKMPNRVMTRFQKAIKDSDWVKALGYCSDKIKSKAEKYDSAETFLKDVLPTDEVIALSVFQIFSTRSHNNEVTMYSCRILLKDPNYKRSFDWNLSAVREGSNWVVEFPVKPLDIWLKHEVLKAAHGPNGREFDREKIRKGFDVRLVPLIEEFTIGSPMLFRIEMKNITDETLGYTHTSFMVNDPMLIKKKGDIIPYIDSGCQTLSWSEFVEPGETVVLDDNYDARSQYHIINHGKYTFQFRGSWDIKSSNAVEKEIRSNPLPALENIVEYLLPMLPDGWKLTRRVMPANEIAETSTSNEVIWIHLIGKRSGKRIGNSVIIAIFLHTPAVRTPDVKLKNHLSEFEYWGDSQWGLIFGKSHDAEQLWPDYKEEIIKALKIQTVSRITAK